MTRDTLLQKGQQLINQQAWAQADTHCREALAHHPNDDAFCAMLSHIAQSLGNYDDTVRYLIMAINAAPQNLRYKLSLATIFSRNAKIKELIQLSQQILAEQPDCAECYYILAVTFNQYNQLQKTVDYCHKAITCKPDYADAYDLLISKYLQLNEAKKATETIETAKIHIDIQALRPHMAQLCIKQKDLEQAKKHFQDYLDTGNINEEKQGMAYAELAKIYQKQQDYDAAFNTMEQAQNLLKTYAEQHEKLITNEALFYTDSMEVMANYTAWLQGDIVEQFKKLSAYKGTTPSFVLGFLRSGTTLLEQVLAAHPRIAVLGEQGMLHNAMVTAKTQGVPVPYPASLLNFKEKDKENLRDTYMREASIILQQDLSNKHVVDKMPPNTIHLAFIEWLYPGAPIIMLLRDPRDVCLSSFFQTFRYNSATKHLYTLEDTVKFYARVMDMYFHYRNILDLNILEMRYEDMVSDLEPHARKIIEFLGEEWDDAILNYYQQKREVATPSSEAVTKPTYTSAIGKWKNYEKQFAPYQEILKPYVEAFGYV